MRIFVSSPGLDLHPGPRYTNLRLLTVCNNSFLPPHFFAYSTTRQGIWDVGSHLPSTGGGGVVRHVKFPLGGPRSPPIAPAVHLPRLLRDLRARLRPLAYVLLLPSIPDVEVPPRLSVSQAAVLLSVENPHAIFFLEEVQI